jgi:polyhydroxyalkanoate synthesis regulator phasin
VRDEIKRMALFGSGVAELTRHRAEQLVRDLVKAGDVGRDQASTVARDLMDRSKQNRMEVMRLIRTEIQGQITNLGLATRRDLERIERRVARLEEGMKQERAGTPSRTTARKPPAKKTSRRKPIPKKTTARSPAQS